MVDELSLCLALFFASERVQYALHRVPHRVEEYAEETKAVQHFADEYQQQNENEWNVCFARIECRVIVCVAGHQYDERDENHLRAQDFRRVLDEEIEPLVLQHLDHHLAAHYVEAPQTVLGEEAEENGGDGTVLAPGCRWMQ